MKTLVTVAVVLLVVGQVPSAQSSRLAIAEHKLSVTSTVPAIAGQTVEIYVRERFLGDAPPTSLAPNHVVLFVHGAGTPAEVAFDVPHGDYSWMAYLANAGFDVFAMDTTGYGRSVRPAAMNDPCNLAPAAAGAVRAGADSGAVPGEVSRAAHRPSPRTGTTSTPSSITSARCARWRRSAWWPGRLADPGPAATPRSTRRRCTAWCCWRRPTTARRRPQPPALPNPGPVFNTQSRAEFDANWDRQVGCPSQVDPAVRETVWKEMLASDPVGAKWGTGVRRAPSTTSWGWNAAAIGGTKAPTLMIAAALDKQVPAERVQAAYADHGASDKVLLDLGCSSHNAMWEANHLLMFKASLDWLTKGTVEGTRSGVVKLGYPKS